METQEKRRDLKNTNAKAQGLSLNTIVIAALVLIVMVVVIAIFTGGVGEIGGWFGECTSKGAKCSLPDACESKGGIEVPGRGCGENEICCGSGPDKP